MDTLKKHPIAFFIWAALLLVSDLPNILLVKQGGVDPGWLPWAKIGLLAGFFLLIRKVPMQHKNRIILLSIQKAS